LIIVLRGIGLKKFEFECYETVFLQTTVVYLTDNINVCTSLTLSESMKRDLTKPDVRARLQYLSSDQWKVGSAQKTKDDTPQASFRKLNID